MAADIPVPVQRVLSEYIILANTTVPGLLVGLYLHESLVLGAFNPGLSDIDFIAAPAHPRLLLEGSYLQWSDFGRREESVPPHPYSHDRIPHASGPRATRPIDGLEPWPSTVAHARCLRPP